jgi:iron complex outermembrane receptor protein
MGNNFHVAVRAALLAGAGYASLVSGSAWAQSTTTAPLPTTNAPPAASPVAAPAATTPQDNDNATDDIIVTAQKRSENAQNVPIAMTALPAEKLASAGITTTADLKALTPGLNFNTALAGYGQPRIRGVGTTAQGPGIENPVATYVDGVYIASPSGAIFSLNDISQVTVLKGPQGTLFGRNATGGLVQVTTRTPSEQATGDFQVSYGNYDTIGGSAYLSGGLTDTLAASGAFFFEKQNDGFGVNVATGNDIQTHRSIAGRAKLLWEPDSATRFTLGGDYADYRSADPAFQTLGYNIFGGVRTGGARDVDVDLDPFVRTKNWGLSLNAQHDFAGVQLMSITAYRESSLFTRFEADETTAPLLNLAISQNDKQFSQEFQLLSTGAGPFKWVAGLFYFHADQRYDPSETYGAFLPGVIDLYTNETLNSYAAYAQGTYSFGGSTNLTAGLRYTIDDRRTVSSQTLTIGSSVIPAGGPIDQSKAFKKLTWRLSLDHRFSDEVLGYISYNRGFKGGSFTAMNFPAIELKPETLDAYEVGIKSDLFDRRVRLNVAAFYYNYVNLQVNQIENGLLFVYNANGAHTYGLDADLEARVTKGLTLNAGISLLHDRYTSFPNAFTTTPIIPVFPPPANNAPNGGNLVGTGDATGKRLQNTPDVTFNIGFSYEVETQIGKISLAANNYYNGGYFTAPENRLRQPHYDVVDASITWLSRDNHFSLKIWGKNLGDTVYSTQIDATNFGDSRGLAPPRTFGATAGFHF